MSTFLDCSILAQFSALLATAILFSMVFVVGGLTVESFVVSNQLLYCALAFMSSVVISFLASVWSSICLVAFVFETVSLLCLLVCLFFWIADI